MKKDKNLDKFLKENINIERSSLDFTNKVMQQIVADEKNKEKALFSLLQKNLLEEPSADFTSNIMSLLKPYAKTSVYTPVIGKKVWILITSLFISVLAYTIFNLEITQTYFTGLDQYIPSFNMDFSFNLPPILTSPLFAMSIFALSSLLFLDYFIRNRRFAS